MPGRELTPSEIQDKQYNELFISGCVAIVLLILCIFFYQAMTPEKPRDVFYLNFDKNLNDANYSSKDSKTLQKEPIVFDTKIMNQTSSGVYYKETQEKDTAK